MGEHKHLVDNMVSQSIVRIISVFVSDTPTPEGCLDFCGHVRFCSVVAGYDTELWDTVDKANVLSKTRLNVVRGVLRAEHKLFWARPHRHAPVGSEEGFDLREDIIPFIGI